MVTEAVVLLRIKHLQQRRSRITAKIRSHFINLVQQEYRVHAAAGLHTVNNTARHRTDIGTAMTADFRFITHTAQRNAGKFTLNRLGNTACQACFTYARRSYQTQNRTACAFGQRTYCQILQDTLLNLLQAVVIFIKNVLRLIYIKIILGKFAPGQRKQRIDIGTDYRSLRRHRRHFRQTSQLLVDFFRNVLRHFQLGHLLLVVSNFCLYVFVFAKLLADSLNLFTQIIFLLILLHLLVYLLGNIFGYIGNFLLTHQNLV